MGCRVAGNGLSRFLLPRKQNGPGGTGLGEAQRGPTGPKHLSRENEEALRLRQRAVRRPARDQLASIWRVMGPAAAGRDIRRT